MGSKLIIVIDMQNDFVHGLLGTAEAKATIGNIRDKILRNVGGEVIFTQDTHFADYMNTHEGEWLPVPHCVRNTSGWDIIPELKGFADETYCLEKGAFGYDNWDSFLIEGPLDQDWAEIELCGVCTDICVVSNALMLRSLFPNTNITVDASCCAGTSIAKHNAALDVMESCHINVINRE